MVLVLLAVYGLIYGNSEVARREILHQLYSFLDRSSAKAVEDIATSAGKPTASALATVVGIAVALFGASGVFGQLQEALNTIWGVKPKPGRSLVSFRRARFLLANLKPFHPHVAIGRAKGIFQQALQSFLRSHAETAFGLVKVTGFELYSSMLAAGGATHRVEMRQKF